MRLIFAASAADRNNRAPTSERLVNFYPVPAPEGAIAAFSLRSVPGTREWVTLSAPFLRALANVEGRLYAVSRGGLYRVSETGLVSYSGAVTDDPETSVVGARDKVAVAAGGTYYLLDGGTLSQPGSGRIAQVNSVAFCNQYTVLFGDREIEWTEAGLPGSRNALYFATAEAKDDLIVRGFEQDGYIWAMKQRSLEMWQTSGSGSSAFSRATVRNIGLKGYRLACNTPGGIFFIGSDNTARFLQGGEPRPVSTPPLDNALARETPTDVFYYEDRGHRLCNIRFANRPAWVYDASMDRCHERAQGVAHDPWDVTASAECYGQWLLGSRLGKVYKTGLAPYDATGPMRRTAVSRTLYDDAGEFSVNRLEILGEFGTEALEEAAPNWLTNEYGLPLIVNGGYLLASDQQAVSQISAPVRISMRTSRDGGKTWDAPRIEPCGVRGDYEARAQFLALGQFRRFTCEVNMTDPVDVPILAEALVE